LPCEAGRRSQSFRKFERRGGGCGDYARLTSFPDCAADGRCSFAGGCFGKFHLAFKYSEDQASQYTFALVFRRRTQIESFAQ
jgi:hypothetical protein